jgi:hypothetical protein
MASAHAPGTRFRDVVFRSVCFTLLVAISCTKGPPPDFAPDPGLVERIREIRMMPHTTRACPGERFRVDYVAVLDDGSRVPFESRYDESRPPRLHMNFLDRHSREAHPQGDGSWVAASDPMVSLTEGYTLSATLSAKPGLSTSARLEPEYSCLDHSFDFRGSSGRQGGNREGESRSGGPGGDGPDVTVRLGVVRSPFIERLLVAAIEVGHAEPEYYVADANQIAPREWLVIESTGGNGGKGREGAKGQPGVAGAQGCPGGAGGAGANGENGGPGGVGGRGGRITIITAVEEPFLAGVVDARAPGGHGGEGGKGGAGGAGGTGGAAIRPECSAGPAGPAGRPGNPGRAGVRGHEGPRPQVITVPLRDVFGQRVPPALAELLDASR